MKNRKIRTFSVLLALIITLGLLPYSALADYGNGTSAVVSNDLSAVIRVELDRTSCKPGDSINATVSLRNVNGTTAGLTGSYVSELFVVTLTDSSYNPVSYFSPRTADGLDAVCRFTFPASCTLTEGTYKITAKKQVGSNIFFGEASFTFTPGQPEQPEQTEQPEPPVQTEGTEPFIITQPKNRTVVSGSMVTFSVKAEGQGLKYRWYVQKKAENSWTKISGATKAELTFTAAMSQSGNHYRCRITSAGGNVTSEAAKLTVVSMPKISSQPANACVHNGEKVTFKVKASGGGLKYQWYYQKPESSQWVTITNATGASYTFTAKLKRDGYKYRCLVENKAGSVYTRAAKLIVK